MKPSLPGPLATGALLLGLAALGAALMGRRAPSAEPAVVGCDGAYADALHLNAPRVRDIEQGPRSRFTYLIRSTATYECPYFAANGKLQRRKVDAVEHGTAFAYEVQGADTFLLTNEHVITWPEVTDATHRVDDVPEGCKRVDERLRIVHDERDQHEPGHVLLSRVAVDPLLDAAIIKAGQRLTTLPYRIGRSAGVRQGTAVQVRGFPLGLIHAVNTGKVVNPYDRDQEQGWDHVDFVTDALLSEGNSGSPVLALSCKSGELELVGMYHAGYKGHSALNVVVGIDQLREFMKKKRRLLRAPSESTPAETAAARRSLVEALRAGALPVFEFGGLVVWAEVATDNLVLHIYGRDFPRDERRLLVLEERPGRDGAHEVSRLWLPDSGGWQARPLSLLGADERELLDRAAASLRDQMTHTLAYRRTLATDTPLEERRRGRELQRTLERNGATARELGRSLADLAEQLTPGRGAPVAAANAPDAGPPPSSPRWQHRWGAAAGPGRHPPSADVEIRGGGQ